MSSFPEQKPGLYYLTEGGVETEILYKWGYELPHFAMFPLLERSDARSVIRDMYKRYLDVTARYGLAALMGGFDYRASPDWGAKLGYSRQGLHDATIGSIEFLRELAGEYQGALSDTRIMGYVGPRGDAYLGKSRMSVEESRDYHSVQVQTLKTAKVDLITAMTFNAIDEAIGVVEACRAADIPVSISFSLDSSHHLNTGPSLKDAIAQVDAATDHYTSFFGLNCSHPYEFEPAIDETDWMKRVRVIRPNAAKMDKISLCKLGHLEEGNPVELGQQMASVLDRFPHMDIWGGCCGTCETHLEEIAKHLPVKIAA